MEKTLLLPSGKIMVADEKHYTKAFSQDLFLLYKKYNIHTFDFTAFSKYSDKRFTDFFKEIRLVEDSSFLNEVYRILNEKQITDLSLIPYIIDNSPIDILPAYYRIFSQVSLILDSSLHTNLTLNKNFILSGLNKAGCRIINNLSDIEVCCFIIRFCDNTENILVFKAALCPLTFNRVEAIIKNRTKIKEICNC